MPPITNHQTSGTTVLKRRPIIINPRPPTPSTGLLRLTRRGGSRLDMSHSATTGSIGVRLSATGTRGCRNDPMAIANNSCDQSQSAERLAPELFEQIAGERLVAMSEATQQPERER